MELQQQEQLEGNLHMNGSKYAEKNVASFQIADDGADNPVIGNGGSNFEHKEYSNNDGGSCVISYLYSKRFLSQLDNRESLWNSTIQLDLDVRLVNAVDVYDGLPLYAIRRRQLRGGRLGKCLLDGRQAPKTAFLGYN